MTSNPASRLGKYNKKPVQVEEEIKPLSEDQAVALREAVEKHWLDHYALFTTLIKAGLRIGEALALDWTDLDWQTSRIFVNKAWAKGRMRTTKTGRNRWVDLSPGNVQVLREHHLRLGRPEAGPMFPNSEGGRLNENNLRERVYHPVLVKARIARRALHQLRHTYATLSLMNGANFMYVSRQLGHANPNVTLTVYARWIPTPERKDVAVMDNLAGRNQTQPGRNQAFNPPLQKRNPA